VGDRVTEVAGEAEDGYVDAGRRINELMKGQKVGHKAISKWTMLSGKFQ
jgi:hypothetical protein